MKKCFLAAITICFFFVSPLGAQPTFDTGSTSENRLAASRPHSFCPPATTPELRSMYVRNAHTIIGDNEYEEAVLGWAETYGFNYLILYKIKQFLANAPNGNSVKLGDFIEEAHSRGIEIGIVVPSYNGSEGVRAYLDHSSVANFPNRWYDAIHFEQEYWNSNNSYVWDDGDPTGEPNSFKETLEFLYGFCQEKGILCEIYIGNPTSDNGTPNAQGQIEVDHMAMYTDRIHVAYYRSHPYTPSPNIFLFKKYRLNYLANASSPVNVSVLFSARGSSSDANMFSWLVSLVSDPLAVRWKLPFNVWHDCDHGYLDNLINNTDNLNLPLENINVLGYTWYTYQDLASITPPYAPYPNPFHFTPDSDDTAVENRADIFPNPANDQFEVSVTGTEINATYRILDVNGRMVQSGNLRSSVNTINVENLAEGIYFFQLNNEGEDLSLEKIIIQR